MSVSTEKIQVRELEEQDQPLLERMYETFEPQGVALGLPPFNGDRRRAWLAELRQGFNVVAFLDGSLAGHLAMMPSGRVGELAIFVHQDFRRRGVATTLAQAAVRQARAMGLSALTVFIDSSNFSARRGLLKFGFHAAWEDLQEAQMVYPLRRAAKAA